jgi:hypothetical protein
MRSRRFDSKLHKMLRLSAFLFFAQAVASLFLVRAVRAEVRDLMLSAGAQMMQLGKELGGQAPRTLRLNGAQIRLRVQSSRQHTLEQVLDEFESRCRKNNGAFYEQLRAAPKTKSWSESQLALFDGVIRVESKDAGAVACFDVGGEQGSAGTLLARARRFADTGDAAAFGELRYVRAERTEQGVFVVMMWNDGPMNIKQMFPSQGDVPGVEFSGLPRPPRSRRVLSAWEEGQAPALNIYEASDISPSALDLYYRSELPKQGWEVMTPRNEDKSTTVRGLMAMRQGVTVTVGNSSLASGGMTTIIPMDTRGDATVSARP